MEVIGYFASFCIGLILGILGSGGSMLTIPVLIYLFSIQIVEATAYSLIIVGTTSMAGALHRLKNSELNFKVGFTFGLPSISSIFFTRKWLIPAIPEIIFQNNDFILSKKFLILALFSILIISSSYLMIKKNTKPVIRPGEVKTNQLVFQGSIIGFIAGFVGIGGGFIILPSLIFLTRLSFNIVVGTTLFIISVNSLIGFLADLSNFSFDWSFLSVILILATLGIFTGNIFSRFVSGKKLKKSFGWFTLSIGIFILIAELISSIGFNA